MVTKNPLAYAFKADKLPLFFKETYDFFAKLDLNTPHVDTIFVNLYNVSVGKTLFKDERTSYVYIWRGGLSGVIIEVRKYGVLYFWSQKFHDDFTLLSILVWPMYHSLVKIFLVELHDMCMLSLVVVKHDWWKRKVWIRDISQSYKHRNKK